jgi:integrase
MEVEPVRDMKDVKRVYDWFMENKTPKEAELFYIGCNVALRAGDLLSLKFSDFDKGDFIDLTERKTGKFKRIPITDGVRKAVERLKVYYSSRKFYVNKEFIPVYLFQSTGSRAFHLCQPICIQWLSACFKLAAEGLKFEFNFNTHSMRKTWGYQAYERGEDILYIQALFNHSNQRVTLNYIGVTRSTIEQMYRDNSLDFI